MVKTKISRTARRKPCIKYVNGSITTGLCGVNQKVGACSTSDAEVLYSRFKETVVFPGRVVRGPAMVWLFFHLHPLAGTPTLPFQCGDGVKITALASVPERPKQLR